MTPRLSVVIVTYRSRGVLPTCLASLAACRADVAFEVIVVDNASGDGTPEWLTAEWPAVRVIANPDNRGFARGVNQGLEQATGEAMLLLNPDCRVTAEGIVRLLETLRGDPSLAAVAPMLLDDAGTPARSCGTLPSLWTLFCEHLGLARAFPESPLFGGSKYGAVPLERLERVGWASGAALLLTRRAYRALGGLDGGFFMYMEEVDWCRRAHQAGLAIRFVPAARFAHSGQHASRQAGERTYLYNLASRVYYFRKHHGRAAAGAAKSILYASLALKWVVARLGGSHAGEPRVYARGLKTVWAA